MVMDRIGTRSVLSEKLVGRNLLGALRPYWTHHLNRLCMYALRERQPGPVNYGGTLEPVRWNVVLAQNALPGHER